MKDPPKMCNCVQQSIYEYLYEAHIPLLQKSLENSSMNLCILRVVPWETTHSVRFVKRQFITWLLNLKYFILKKILTESLIIRKLVKTTGLKTCLNELEILDVY